MTPNLKRFGLATAQVAVGQIAQQVTLLARNLLLARLLPPEQYGIALSVLVLISAVDSLSDLGIDTFLIRSKREDSLKLMPTLHSLNILRGISLSIIMLLASGPYAQLVGHPDAASSYRLLAILPLIRCTMHLDPKRFEKDYRFWPGALASLLSSIVGMAAAVFFALTLKSYEAMIYSVFVQYGAWVILSHVVAVNRYSLGWIKSYIRPLLQYGLPLTANGILLFFVTQGDRLLVTSTLGTTNLAYFGAAATVTSGLTMLVMRVTGALYLPALSQVEAGSDLFKQRFILCGLLSTLVAISMAIPGPILAERIIYIAFGPAYAEAGTVLALLFVQSAFRVLRSWSQAGFLATGQTHMLFVTNIISATGLLISCVALLYRPAIETVAIGYLISEFIALLFSMVLRGYRTGITLLSLASVLVGACASMLYHFAHPAGVSFSIDLAVAFLIWSAVTFAVILFHREYLKVFKNWVIGASQ